MKKIILAGVLILGSFSQTFAANDVSELEAANFLWAENIIVDQKLTPKKYNLEKNILRQEIAWTIAKLSNLPANQECKNLFADVKITADNSWACPRIESLLNAGMIAKNQYYRPASYVSKAEALWFILWALYKDEYNSFKNANLSWEENAINFAKSKNILREEIKNYTENASRWFIFKIIYYAKKSQKVEETKTENKVIVEEKKENKDELEKVLKEIFWEDTYKILKQ